jgi:hypothetical protein
MDLPQFDDAIKEGDGPVLGENAREGTERVLAPRRSNDVPAVSWEGPAK